MLRIGASQHLPGSLRKVTKSDEKCREPLGGIAGIGCVARQQDAEGCVYSSHGMLDSRRLLSDEPLVPAAHTRSVEVPLGGGPEKVSGAVVWDSNHSQPVDLR